MGERKAGRGRKRKAGATARPARTARRRRPEDAIGVFDSGIGGLTVLEALSRRIPREHLIYLGDTARVPYGTKSSEAITAYAIETADFFGERGVKLMVLACNTTSALAIDVLRSRYPIPIIGVVEPGARAALTATRNGRIGVIGTEATIASGAYPRCLRARAPDVEIFTRACPLFVPLAEEGWTENDIARRTASFYLASLKKSGIDTLILGCTHYPLLRKVIADFLGPSVRLVDSAEETAREVRRVLASDGIARSKGKGSASFFVTDAADRFMRIGERFYGATVASAVRVVLKGG
ncbi:MAG: glutamate racemase [Deltaproteobacteria bacterium]|nr:glutamate racemase [Deltaproteobacteria bacterium]